MPGAMSIWEHDPYEAVVAELCADPAVRRARMMGMPSVTRAGKMFAGLWHGELVVKLGSGRVDELVESARAERFDPIGGRPMKDWAAVPEPVDDWLSLAEEARELLAASQTG